VTRHKDERPENEFNSDTETAPIEVQPLIEEDQARVPVLIVMSGEQIGQRHEIDTQRVRIGRADDAELTVQDVSISRYHAQVYQNREGRWCVRDMGSTNGTFVNGRRVEEAALSSGDRVQVGEAIIVGFEHQGRVEGEFYEKLYQAGTHDPALGIFNLSYAQERLEGDFRLARRQREPLSVLLLDLDNFRLVNEAHGRPTGDRLLRVVAELVSGRLRGEDVLARHGGEELLVVLRNTPLAGALALAETLRACISEAPLEVRGLEIAITVSTGVATYAEATPFRDHGELLAAAHSALHRAKLNGRDRVEAASMDDLSRR